MVRLHAMPAGVEIDGVGIERAAGIFSSPSTVSR
jgi:hypothetical protein